MNAPKAIAYNVLQNEQMFKIEIFVMVIDQYVYVCK